MVSIEFPKSETMGISMEDALDYARKVMKKFNKETNTFKKFRHLMGLYRGDFIDCETLTSEVHTLFKGQDDLIQGFHRFFPDNHGCTCSTIPLSDGVEGLGAGRNLTRKAGKNLDSSGQHRSQEEDERKQQCDRASSPSDQDESNLKEESIEFLNTVRKTLKNDLKYREFLETLCKYQDHKDIDRLDKEALQIFRRIPELHIEFSRQLGDKIEGCPMTRRNPYPYRNRKINNNVNP